MFTKEDYQGYFLAVKRQEEMMVERLNAFMAVVKDEDLMALLKDIKSDENRHLGISEALISYAGELDK